MMTEALEQDADAAAAAGNLTRARDILRRVAVEGSPSFDVWIKLSALERATGDIAAALDAISRALALRPLDFTALLMHATTLHGAGQTERAGQAYGHALAQAPATLPRSLEPAMATARERFRHWQDEQAAALHDAVPPQCRSAKIDRMIDAVVRREPPERDGPTHYCYPGLPATPFYDPAQFGWIEALEAATDIIQTEFETVAAAHAAERVPYIQYPDTVPVEQWRALNHNRDWTAIHLINRGEIVDANAQHCPQVMELLRSIPQPDIRGAGPNAMFSLLAPHTHIPPHTGIANTRLVCHLPLIVPEGCWFRVGDDRRNWERSQLWVFDDTIEHEAMNPSAALRVVLIFDLWHPDLSALEREGIAAVVGAGGRVHGL